jgi:hypothetical protein
MKTILLLVLLFCGQAIAQTTVILPTNYFEISLYKVFKVDDLVRMKYIEMPKLTAINDSMSKVIIPNNELLYFRFVDEDDNEEIVGIKSSVTTTVNLSLNFNDEYSVEMIYNKETKEFDKFYLELAKL